MSTSNIVELIKLIAVNAVICRPDLSELKELPDLSKLSALYNVVKIEMHIAREMESGSAVSHANTGQEEIFLYDMRLVKGESTQPAYSIKDQLYNRLILNVCWHI